MTSQDHYYATANIGVSRTEKALRAHNEDIARREKEITELKKDYFTYSKKHKELTQISYKQIKDYEVIESLMLEGKTSLDELTPKQYKLYQQAKTFIEETRHYFEENNKFNPFLDNPDKLRIIRPFADEMRKILAEEDEIYRYDISLQEIADDLENEFSPYEIE